MKSSRMWVYVLRDLMCGCIKSCEKACTVMSHYCTWLFTGLSIFSLCGVFHIPVGLLCLVWERSWTEGYPAPGLRASGPSRHARCHATPKCWWRIRRWRWRWQWNQTLSRYFPILQLQHGFSRACQGLQEWFGELGHPRYPQLRPKLHHAAGQRCAQVCWRASPTQRGVQLQRYVRNKRVQTSRAMWHHLKYSTAD